MFSTTFFSKIGNNRYVEVNKGFPHLFWIADHRLFSIHRHHAAVPDRSGRYHRNLGAYLHEFNTAYLLAHSHG